MRVMRVVTCAIVAAGFYGCAKPAPPTEQPRQVIGITGRENATPSIASREHEVALTWSAQHESGTTDVFAAISGDDGRTFGNPIQVNGTEAQVRISGEQPPRVAIGPHVLAVVWTAKRDNLTEVRVARSTDNGRSFGASQAVHPAGLTGARGWASIAVDGQDRVHVVWLDGRNAAPMPKHEAGAPPMKHDMRQDVFTAVIDTAGHATESPVASNVCFCCKTTTVVAADGSSATAWRHIYPGSLRDIGFAMMDPSGAVRGEQVRVSEDHWELDGCPDDGPAMVMTASGAIHIVWPAVLPGEPVKGIFYASSTDGKQFTPRARMDRLTKGAAAHPQIALTASGLAVVWDELAGGVKQVMLRERAIDGGTWSEPTVFHESVAAYYPVVAATPDGMILAWTSAADPNSMIGLARVPRAVTTARR